MLQEYLKSTSSVTRISESVKFSKIQQKNNKSGSTYLKFTVQRHLLDSILLKFQNPSHEYYLPSSHAINVRKDRGRQLYVIFILSSELRKKSLSSSSMGTNISQLERDIGDFPANEHYFGLVNVSNEKLNFLRYTLSFLQN